MRQFQVQGLAKRTARDDRAVNQGLQLIQPGIQINATPTYRALGTLAQQYVGGGILVANPAGFVDQHHGGAEMLEELLAV
jgi:hypothetical protein